MKSRVIGKKQRVIQGSSFLLTSVPREDFSQPTDVEKMDQLSLKLFKHFLNYLVLNTVTQL